MVSSYQRLVDDFDTCTDDMFGRRNMFLDRLEDAKRENKEQALQMALLMQATTQAREKLDAFKRRYFWDTSSQSLSTPRPKLPVADELGPPSVERKDPESHLEDLPEISEELSPSSIRSREKQPEQEPDIGVQAEQHAETAAPVQLSHAECQRHLHSLLPQAVPMQHHRMCSPPRLPVYKTSPATPRFVGWQFQSHPPAPGPRYIAEPTTIPRRRVSVSPPRIVGVMPPPPQILGAQHIPWQCSGASVRVPSPVSEGVRAEPGMAMPRRASSPCAPCPSRSDAHIAGHMCSSREARLSGANPGVCLRPSGLGGPCSSPRYRTSLPDPLHGRATVPIYRASPCQFSPRRPAHVAAVRSPSPLRVDHVAPPRAVSPDSPPVRAQPAQPVTYHRASVPVGPRTRTPSPCAPVSVHSGQPLRMVVTAHPLADASRGMQASCQVPPSLRGNAGLSWELPRGCSPPVLHTAAAPVLRTPLRSRSPLACNRGRAEQRWPQVSHVFSPLSRSIQAPRTMEPRLTVPGNRF